MLQLKLSYGTEKISCLMSRHYLTQNLSKYNKREQKLISKVYSILQAILPKDMADMVVAKIQEELSK